MAEQERIFGSVLVGVDGLQGGRDAIALARLLCDPQGELLLAHVRALPDHARERSAEAEQGDNGQPLADALALLERERATSGVQAQLRAVPASSPGRGLHELADAESADLIVVGSSHRGFFGRVLMGNATREALTGSPCAVAVAPRGYAESKHRPTAVGVGYDGSPESRQALTLGRALAERMGVDMKVLQVIPVAGPAYAGFGGVAWGEALEEIRADVQRDLEQAVGPLGEARAMLGIAGEALAELGEEVGLVVVGSRGYGPLRTLLLGSTARYLARHARSPLLVLPRGSEEHAGAVD